MGANINKALDALVSRFDGRNHSAELIDFDTVIMGKGNMPPGVTQEVKILKETLKDPEYNVILREVEQLETRLPSLDNEL